MCQAIIEEFKKTEDQIGLNLNAPLAATSSPGWPTYKQAILANPIGKKGSLVATCLSSGQCCWHLRKIIEDGNESGYWKGKLINGQDKLCPVNLLRDCETRWSSTFLMVDHGLILYPVSHGLFFIMESLIDSLCRPSNHFFSISCNLIPPAIRYLIMKSMFSAISTKYSKFHTLHRSSFLESSHLCFPWPFLHMKTFLQSGRDYGWQYQNYSTTSMWESPNSKNTLEELTKLIFMFTPWVHTFFPVSYYNLYLNFNSCKSCHEIWLDKKESTGRELPECTAMGSGISAYHRIYLITS